MKKFCFLFAFVVSACATALALPTVDFVSTTTSAQAALDTLRALGLFVPVQLGLTALISIMQILKYFFPKIDGKGK